MQISEIQITPIKPNQGLVGFASFVVEAKFYVGSVGIYTRPQGGYRLTYPTKKIGTTNLGIFYPINKETASLIEEVVTNEYEKVIKKYDRYHSFSTT